MTQERPEDLDEEIRELFRLAEELGATGTDDFLGMEENTRPVSSNVQPSRSRYVEFSETDKQELITEQRKKNTVQSTNCAVNQFNKWMRTMRPSETRPISEIPPDVLDCYLGSFYAGVRQKDGSEYEPDSLTTYQRGIDRFLGENGYKFSISRDKEFSNSQATLRAKRAQLKTQGKGNKPNAAEELTEREEELLFEKGVIGTHNPEALLFLVWLNNQKHFGFRGCQESRQMLWGDIALKHTADNTEFLEFNERENKTRSSGKVNEQPRAYPPKAFAIPDDPSRCPVYAYKQYALRRPPSHQENDAPFYLAINYKPEHPFGSNVNRWERTS
ncbi:uncharacterized protein KIAA1958-like [Ptychodera flava]|uniref:uncharacterized protein KIAA1958-like n=1 Tax=Ptychodera flava TaxID=63121 RepID=UPI003969D28B